MNAPPIIRFAIEAMYRTIENEPEYLLEVDGGPVGKTADVVVARLYGHDDQLDHEWRIDQAQAVLLAPIPERLTALAAEAQMAPAIRTAQYGLQSTFATYQIAFEAADHEVRSWIGTDPDRSTRRWFLLALRYKRQR